MKPDWRAGVRDWAPFVDDFHSKRAAITEETLGQAVRRDLGNPYAWILAAVPPDVDLLVDVGCGSAPLQPMSGRRYLGVDRSAAELAQARRRGREAVFHACAERLPLRSGSLAVVTMSMALQVVDVDAVAPEIARVLRRGGRLVATVPAGRLPHSIRDAVAVISVLAALRRVPGYPNDARLRDASGLFAPYGLSVVSDESLDFPLPVADMASALRFVDSLYLAGLSAARRRRAATRLVGRCWPVRIRRLVAEKH